MSKGTPTYAIRLKPSTRASVQQMAELYGSTSTGAFIREMLETMCSDDAEKVQDFMVRLFTRLGEQKQLKLTLGPKVNPPNKRRTRARSK